MYNADGNGDLERGRGPRGLCSAQLCSAPREFYSSAVVVVGFCDFVKMVAYILHSRSVFLFHQLPPLCAIVHNATAGCHISKPFARSAHSKQSTTVVEVQRTSCSLLFSFSQCVRQRSRPGQTNRPEQLIVVVIRFPHSK